MKPHSLYLHVPFCIHRCGYCDFNTYAGQEALIPAYMRALQAELRHLAEQAPEEGIPVPSIFFGGGTPSLAPADLLAETLETIRTHFDLDPRAEISLEANPGSLAPGYLEALRRAGFNRLSLGVQSASPEELRLLERQHDPGAVIEAVRLARQAGFDNLNLDLIFALPGQSLASWQRNLHFALDLQPEHLSLYALTIEHGTPFQKMADRGLLPIQDPDLAAEMYEYAMEALQGQGFAQYEISNWARPGRQCRHNLQYWRNQPYVGLGAGAHGFVDGLRTVNVLAPAAYIRRMEQGAGRRWPRTPATASVEAVDQGREMGETMMMGLRLVEEGISQAGFAERFGQSLEAVYGPQIQRLSGLGLLENGGNRLRLTREGRLLGNQVFREFI